jgi:peroxiredoxin
MRRWMSGKGHLQRASTKKLTLRSKENMKNNSKFITRAALTAVIAGLAFTPGVHAANLETGMYAPDFTFTAASAGRPQKLSDLRGKSVALHFWATWCGPCVRELPLISELTASKSDSITVIAVNCGEQTDDVTSFLSKRKLRLNLIMDKDGSISKLYNVSAIPQTWMIDKNGVIRSIQIGAYNKNTLDRDVSALLKN